MSGLRIVAADQPERVWMGKRKAAAYLGVSVTTLDKWRAEQGLPFMRAGNVVRFERGELDAWVDGLAARRRAG